MILTLFLAAGALNLAPARVKDHIDRMAGLGVPLPAIAFWVGLAMQFTGRALLNNVVTPPLAQRGQVGRGE